METVDSRHKIVIADDSPLYRKLLQATLAHENYCTLVAQDAREALALVSEHRPAILITDWEMPDVTGVELCSLVRQENGSNTYLILLTSNAEKELPDAFLRRCVFHFIEFPEKDLMARIVRVHHPDLDQRLLDQTLKAFYAVREVDGLRKRPSTSELIDWIAVLRRAGIASVELEAGMPFLGALLKREQDLIAFAEATSRGRRPRA